ncbi:alpha/beta hydrolase [Streptomyces sp. HC44]|uniref:Alpha/beta hydrolase n=1 Tax=Streptomyces scabichelini TaxID=2711217 RepID=A0A6G4V3T2_9ACTN|nr:alpha/beta hydrolase [Streptomyces scabichelini]NGO08513.1 alpha/beta hydrolase [Streptomyces scabichelini]
MIGSEWTLPQGFHDVFRHHFTEVGQVRLHHVAGGRAGAETVVLLHGWPQTWYAWRKVMPGLVEAGYRVEAVEYRGAGESTRPAGGYDKATMAADVRNLLDALDAGQVHLVGRDIGLMVAYALAAQWPRAVASLTMLDVPIPGTTVWERAKLDPQTWHFGLHRQRDIAEMLVSGREYDYLSTFYRARTKVAGAVTDDDLAVYARAYAAPGALRAGFELYRAFDQDEQRFAKLLQDKLPMPVLALGGELDNGSLITDMAREAATDVRGAVVPGGGHWTPEENPEVLLEHLLTFLPSVGAVRSP